MTETTEEKKTRNKPSKFDEKMMFRIAKTLKEEFEILADTAMVTVSDLLRALVQAYVNGAKKEKTK